jgi:hypothetical protein
MLTCTICGKEFKIKRYNKNQKTCSFECRVKQSAITQKKNLMEKFGVSNISHLETVKKKKLETRNTDKEIKDLNANIKSKQTRLEKYGDENYVNLELQKQTMLERYGVENIYQRVDILQNAMMKKYGVKSTNQLDWVKEKQKVSKIEKYGEDYDKIIYEEITMKNNLARCGFEHLPQDPIHFEKMLRKRYKFKDYVLPSGKIIKLQGYENVALDLLLTKYTEDEIIFDKQLIPKILYVYEDKVRRYFPDFFIPKDNLIIEVKSTWTIRADKERTKLKQEQCIIEGFNFKYMIMKKNGALINEEYYSV